MHNRIAILSLKNCLNVWTKRSAWPLDRGWYGATSVCLIPFAFINLQNSSEVNCEPLSLTSCCGMPYRANISRRFAIVASIVMLGIISTSNHSEWLSTTIRNILPMNGPAKSMCTLYHGIFGQSHGCKGAGWGLLRDFWQLSHFLTIVAISLSRLGHQMWSRASDFIRTIPGCPVCNSYSTRSRGWLGIITRIPHNKQPSSTVISWRLLKNP